MRMIASVLRTLKLGVNIPDRMLSPASLQRMWANLRIARLSSSYRNVMPGRGKLIGVTRSAVRCLSHNNRCSKVLPWRMIRPRRRREQVRPPCRPRESAHLDAEVVRPCRSADVTWVCFTRCRRQAPTGRHANPTLVGGSDDEAAWHQPVPARAPPMRRLGIWESPCPKFGGTYPAPTSVATCTAGPRRPRAPPATGHRQPMADNARTRGSPNRTQTSPVTSPAGAASRSPRAARSTPDRRPAQRVTDCSTPT